VRVKRLVVMSMSEALLFDPILARFRADLDELYGDSLERAVLFGSRARGGAHQDSDYDVAVFLRNLTDHWREIDRLAAVETDILADAYRAEILSRAHAADARDRPRRHRSVTSEADR
jgi:predicted nucleotidyltransferase